MTDPTTIPKHTGARMVDAVRDLGRESTMRELRAKCRAVERKPATIGVYSTGERCAVALILNRPKLLCAGDTMLYAADRVGQDWLRMCLTIQRDGWDQP